MTQNISNQNSNRAANLDLLRNLSMMLIVTSHFLIKGGALPLMDQPNMPVYGYFLWYLEALAVVSLNAYMLLSGYFLVEGSFKVKRLFNLELTVLFYSVGIFLIAFACGWRPQEGLNIYSIIQFFLPISSSHYWYMTAYFFMYLFTPALSAGVKKLSKKQFQIVLVLLIFVFCIIKSVCPISLVTDGNGNDCIWYLCVFMVAAYIRLHGIPFFQSKKRSILTYFLAAGLVCGVTFLARVVFLKTEKLYYMLSVCFDHNHIFTFIAALAFFCFFLNLKMKENWFSKLVIKLAPYTLGVYLLHEHVIIRYLWPQWVLKITGTPQSGVMWVLSLLLAVVLVYLAGIFVDFIRSMLFRGIYVLLSKIKSFKKFDTWLEQLKIGSGKV